MKKVPLTVKGAEKLRQELHELKTMARPKVIQAIAEARAHGDLRENAEYHAAREQQSFIEGRIRELEAKLANAQIIDVTQINADGKVVFGATVELEDLATGEILIYQIVGEDEADLKQGLISVASPIAKALIGKQAEDVVEVKTPKGTREYAILAVRYE